MQLSKLYSICLLLILILPSYQVQSQDTIQLKAWSDSLYKAKNDTSRINALRKIGVLYKMIQTDSAIYFTRIALALSEKISWTKGIAQNCLNLGGDFIDISKYDSGIYYETKALAAAKIIGDKSRIALIYINRGAAYTESQQYEKAMPDLMEAMRTGEYINNKDRQARAAQGICELYIYQNNNDAALPWAEKALQLAKDINNEELQGTTEISLAGIYFEKNDLKKAEQLLLAAIPKSKAANKTDVVISAIITLGELYNKTHQYQKALIILKEGLQEAKDVNEADQVAAVCNTIGFTYSNLKQYAQAKEFYKQGYEAVKGNTDFQQRQYVNLKGMAESYSALGDFKNAYEASQLAAILKDSSTQKEQNQNLLRLQTQFETQTKEKQIALLKADKQLNEASLQKQKILQYALYIILFLLILIGFLVINRYRSVQRAKRLIEMEKMRNDIARNLHDDIGSTLTSINILSKVALQQTENSITKTNLQKIKNRSAEIMESMSDIVWAINPANDSLDKIILRMKEFATETLEQAGIQFIFHEEETLNDIKLPAAQRNNLYLIFKEAINNAVKYSKAKSLSIFIKRDNDNLFLKLSDDGKGFDMQQKFSGNGLKNMQSRAAEMNAKIQIQSTLNKGTTINLFVPIP